MTGSSMPYNLAVIRELLLAAFTPETLRRFCLDRPTFRPVVSEFASTHGLADMVDELLEYCRTQLLWDELLAEVEQVNPRQVRRFEPQLREPERAEKRAPLVPSEIAAEAVGVLSAYLAQADEGLDTEPAGETWEVAEEIHDAIKVRFRRETDEFALLALRRFEEGPERRKDAIEEVLEEILESDPTFASSLHALLKEQHETGAGTITQHVAISDHAQTGDIVQVGTIQGSIDLGSLRQATGGRGEDRAES